MRGRIEMRLSLLLLLPLLCYGRRGSMRSVLRNIAFDRFVATQFDYSAFLSGVDRSSFKIVPFQDSSNDTFFKVGIISSENLENYTKISLSKEVGELKNKPWFPAQRIREELGMCLFSRYSSLVEHDFKYDKAMYGWMNIMRFTCGKVSDNFYAFGMALARTRFRLAPVFLTKQQQQWATAGRSIITRDVQKIVQVFSTQFGEYADAKMRTEMNKLTAVVGSSQEETDQFIDLGELGRDSMAALFPGPLNHTSLKKSKKSQFDTMAIPIITRLLVLPVSNVSKIVPNYVNELSDTALDTLENCEKAVCVREDVLTDVYSKKPTVHNFTKERAISVALTEKSDADKKQGKQQQQQSSSSSAESDPLRLLAWSSAKPSFTFNPVKRRTVNGIVDMPQRYEGEAESLWKSLLDQQLSDTMRVHFGDILD